MIKYLWHLFLFYAFIDIEVGFITSELNSIESDSELMICINITNGTLERTVSTLLEVLPSTGM